MGNGERGMESGKWGTQWIMQCDVSHVRLIIQCPRFESLANHKSQQTPSSPAPAPATAQSAAYNMTRAWLLSWRP